MKKITALVLCLAMAFCLAACGQSSSQQSSEQSSQPEKKLSGSLTLYTSEPEALVSEMIAEFNKLYPDVEIKLYRSGTGDVVAKMQAEYETGSTEANIIWFANIGYMKELDDKGEIMHYLPAGSDKIDQQYIYNDGMGLDVRLIYNVMAYNTTKVTSDYPTDWADLADEQYKGSVAMADPNYSGGAFTALVVHVQNDSLAGWKLYDMITANDCKYAQSNGDLKNKVASGEYSVVAIVDSHARAAIMEGSPVQMVWPESGAVLIPTPVCMMNNIPAESVDAARAFMDYLLTVDNQKLFVEQGYIPVNPEAGLPEATPEGGVVTMPFDLDYYASNSAAIREEYGKRYGA